MASGNYTVGEIADLVRNGMENKLKKDIQLDIRYQQDFRNYKVSIEKARNILSFKPRHDIESIVNDLIDHREAFKDLGNPQYSNIQVFKELEKKTS